MRAVQVAAQGGAELVDAPSPEPAPGEVVVRVEAAALCATDRKFAARGSGEPRIPGHEFAGRLEDGTPVGVHPDVGCGHCQSCRAGFENRCPARSSLGLDRDGGLAEAVAVPAAHAVPLDGLRVELSPILEPLACCLHAVSLLEVRSGEPALVVGAGSMGILSTWALQQAGATVAVCQRSPERRRLAAELGADAVFGPDERAAAALGEAPRVAIVTAPGPEALDWALGEVVVGGSVHAFAGAPDGAPVDANLVHYRHLSLVGSTGSRLADYVHAVELVAAGAIDLERLPTSTIALEAVPDALLREDPDPLLLKVVVDVKGGTR
jgi:threonine dehydrogenase-like Zn-dependent dehydrogenase